MTAIYKHPEFRQGVRDMSSVAPGIAAWGMMTGVVMVKSGLSLPEALLMGLTVFAGSSQLAAMPLIAAGAPMWVILATAFCVNLRFVVFSAHLRPYIMHQPLLRRMLSGYMTADLSYVLFTRRYPQPSSDPTVLMAQDAYWAGNSAVNWASWTIPGLLGIVLAPIRAQRAAFEREFRFWRHLGAISVYWHQLLFASSHAAWIEKHSQKKKNRTF